LAFQQGSRPQELVDGAKITVEGTLAVEREGYKSFLVVKTGAPYVAVFGPQDRRVVREIWVTLAGENDALRRYIGQTATVSGKVQLEPNSPHYFNGTLILAESVRIGSGVLLVPATEAKPAAPPVELKGYSVEVTLSKLGQFSYEGWDANGHSLAAVKGLLSCGLSGGGDVVNCACADGFKPRGIGRIESGRFVLTEKATWVFAQFEVPEDGGVEVKRGVGCVRELAR
jgi:hypothetical protein